VRCKPAGAVLGLLSAVLLLGIRFCSDKRVTSAFLSSNIGAIAACKQKQFTQISQSTNGTIFTNIKASLDSGEKKQEA